MLLVLPIDFLATGSVGDFMPFEGSSVAQGWVKKHITDE
jgi:hypothetical protein